MHMIMSYPFTNSYCNQDFSTILFPHIWDRQFDTNKEPFSLLGAPGLQVRAKLHNPISAVGNIESTKAYLDWKIIKFPYIAQRPRMVIE